MRRRVFNIFLLTIGITAAALALSAVRPEARRQQFPVRKFPPPEDAGLPANARTLDEVVLSEDFEYYAPGALPRHWTAIDADGGYCSWFERASTWQVFERGDFTPRSGRRMLMCHFNDGAAPNDDYIILPPQTLNGTITLAFWAASQDPAYPESFEVRVSTTGRSAADFTNVIAQATAVPAQWTQYVYDLSAFTGAPFHAAIRYTAADRFVLKIDDVTVDGTPPPSGWIAGTVRDTAQQAVAEALVILPVLGDTLRSGMDGRFATGRLSVETYSLIVSHEFQQPRLVPGLVVAANETTRVDPVMTPLPLAFRTYPSSSIPGNITDFDTVGIPLYEVVFDTLPIFDLDVSITLEHSYVGDLSVWLRSPEPERFVVPLIGPDPFRSGRNIQNCRFNDESERPFGAGVAPYTTRFRPAGSLAGYNNRLTLGFVGNQVRRTWGLFAYDHSAGDEGRLLAFTLHVAVSKGLVSGTVRRALGSTALPGVTVTVVDGSIGDSAVTNSAGLYFLPAVPGARTIRFSHPRFYAREVPEIAVALAAVRYLDVSLDSVTAALPEFPAPERFEFADCYPNPFNGGTHIRFALPRSAPVTLTVYTLAGRQVRQLVDEILAAGVHEIPFAADDLASGIYLARVTTGAESRVIKMLLTR